MYRDACYLWRYNITMHLNAVQITLQKPLHVWKSVNNTGCKHFKTCVQQTQPNMMLNTLSYFLRRILHLFSQFCLLWLLQSCVQARWITALLSISLSLGPSMTTTISHWCLVRSQPFTGTHTFLAGYVWIPSSVGSLLSTGSETVEATGFTTMEKTSPSFLCCFLRRYAELWNVAGPTCT